MCAGCLCVQGVYARVHVQCAHSSCSWWGGGAYVVACTFACVRVDGWVRVYVCACACLSVHVHICIYAHVHMRAYLCESISVYMCVHMRGCLCESMCIYEHLQVRA